MKLNAKQMQAFLAVVETGSFERAADRVFVTPSAVSQRVHALEERLGTSVVVRGRPCEPTKAGVKLMYYIRRAMLLEGEFLNFVSGETTADEHLSVVMAVNGDTLSTWFFPALAEIFVSKNILLELLVEDQDHTFALLESGRAIGCIGTRSLPMRGCLASLLGSVRYLLVASPNFMARWFSHGITRDSARKAPILAYSRKDTLQSDFMQLHFGLNVDAYPTHYLPLPEARLKAICRGVGYGMVPYMQVRDLLESGKLIDVAPGSFTDIDLYWHAWASLSSRMNAFSETAVHAARRIFSKQGS